MWPGSFIPLTAFATGCKLLGTLGLGGLDRRDSSGGEGGEAPLTGSLSVISADFNRDGVADLAVITPGAELLVLLGTKGGQYRRSFRCKLGGQAHSLHAADLDGDGMLDIAVARRDHGGFRFLRGKGDGTFSRAGRVVALPPTTWSLTPRENEVARLAAAGYTCAEIARTLGISRRTAETHVEAIRSKLELKHKRELVHFVKPRR
jgi:DNA-binding CsgD family transcriptional regulator